VRRIFAYSGLAGRILEYCGTKSASQHRLALCGGNLMLTKILSRLIIKFEVNKAQNRSKAVSSQPLRIFRQNGRCGFAGQQIVNQGN
jgi:hypothetical protein